MEVENKIHEEIFSSHSNAFEKWFSLTEEIRSDMEKNNPYRTTHPYLPFIVSGMSSGSIRGLGIQVDWEES